MAIGDVYELTIVWHNTITDEDVTSRVRGQQNLLVAPDVGTLEDDVVAAWETSLSTADAWYLYYPSSIVLTKVKLQRIDPFEAIILENSDNLPSVGGASSEAGRPQDCILASIRTAKAGRSYRGRMYFPTPGEAITTNTGNLTNAQAVAFALQTSDFFDSLVADSFEPGVYSTQHNKVAVTEFNARTNVLVDTRLRTQRRRTVRAPAYGV